MIKIGILKWPGHVFRKQELDPCRKLAVVKPEVSWRVGKHELRWLEYVEEDLKKMA
jgi:hypothetical protein